MQLLRKIFEAEIVSISILTEGDAGGLFHNIVFTALFICLRMWFYVFSILTKLVNNKAGMQWGGDGCQWNFWLPWHFINKQPMTFGS